MSGPNFVSLSQLESHRKCPQSWAYKQVRGLTRPDSGGEVERDLGTWWHLIMAVESYNRGLKRGTLKSVPKELGGVGAFRLPITSGGQVPLKEVFELMGQWWKRLPLEDRTIWTDKLGESPMHRIKYLFEEWRSRWASDLKKERPLAIEFKWRSQLTADTVMGGYADEIYFDEERNLTVVRDHKTSGNISNRTTEDDLTESQLQVYAWGCRDEVASWGYSLTAVGYDRVRVIKPKIPSLTQTGTLSKSVTDYDLRTYREWAAGPDGDGIPWGEPGTYYQSGAKKGQPKFGIYTEEEAMIKKLSSVENLSKWFDRTLVPLNKNVVGAHIYAARDTAAATLLTREQVDERGYAARNFGRLCSWCDFQKLCLSEIIGGPITDLTEEHLLEFGLEVGKSRR